MSKIMESINAVQEKQNKSFTASEPAAANEPAAVVPSKARKMPGMAGFVIPVLIMVLIAFQAASFMQMARRSSQLEKNIKNAITLISDIDNKGSNIEGSLKAGLDEIAALKDQIKAMQEKGASLDQKLESAISSNNNITESVDKLKQSSKANADYLTILSKRIDELTAQLTQVQAPPAQEAQAEVK